MAESTIAYQKTKNSFEKFLEWTNEKKVLGKEVVKIIKSQYKSLLDVGAGNGDLTLLVANCFQNITLLEPSEPLYETLKKKFPKADIYNVKVEEFTTNKTFDFILASHVFIYIEKPEEIINKLYSLLSPGGKLLIIMLDRTGEYLRYIDHFKKDLLDSSPNAGEYRWKNIVDYLSNENISYQIKDIVTDIIAPSISDFLSLNDFHFNTNVSQLPANTIQKMRAYLKKYEKENCIKINVKHKFIIVEK